MYHPVCVKCGNDKLILKPMEKHPHKTDAELKDYEMYCAECHTTFNLSMVAWREI